ncbi:MAG: sensor histidine kinase [Vicinamibacterales bacterium]
MSSRWSDRLRRTIGLRLAVWYAGIFLVSSLVIVGLTYGLLATSLAARDHEIVESTLREYASRYQAGGLPALANAVEIEQRSGRRERLFVRVVGPFEEVLLYTLPPEWGDFDVSGLRRDGTTGDLATAPARDRSSVLEVASLVLDDGTVLQVGKSTESRDELLSHFRTVLAGVGGVALAIGLVGGLVLTRSTLRPVRDLAAAVRHIVDTGQTTTRVPAGTTGDALDELSALFNRMLDRITTLISGMRDALDNVAHDLRTPMTRLRVTAEAAMASGDAARQREALADCLEESDRVLSMLDTLMDISEAETGTMRLALAEIAVADVVHEVRELYEDVAEDRGIAIETEVPAALTVRADRDRLRQVLANLVDNAVKYTPEGGRVRIDASAAGDHVEIRVGDTGPGIPPHDLPRIWDRLYRGDRSRSARGLGLGLSLVKACVEAHGGRVEAENRPGGGAQFTIDLPAKPDLSPV